MQSRFLPFLLAAALAGGCATTDGPDGPGAPAADAPAAFTKLETQSLWLAPAELERQGLRSVAVALIDLDFSKPETELVLSIASFRPDGNAMRLAVAGDPVRVKTVAALRDELAKRTTETPIGLVVTAGGKPLGAGAEVSPEMQAFLGYFLDQLGSAGVKFAILAPEKLTVERP